MSQARQARDVLGEISSKYQVEPGKRRFLMGYCRWVAEFRLRVIKKDDDQGLSSLFEIIEQERKAGEKLGFSEQDLTYYNQAIRDYHKTEGRIIGLIGRVTEELERERS